MDLFGGGREAADVDVEYKPYPMPPTGGIYNQGQVYNEAPYVQPYTYPVATGSNAELPVASQMAAPAAAAAAAAAAPVSNQTATRDSVWGDLTVEVSFQRGLIETVLAEGADDADICCRI
jgi:hypothetical protein